MIALFIDSAHAQPGPACALFKGGHLFRVFFSYYPAVEGLDTVTWERSLFRGAVDLPRAADVMKMNEAGATAAGYAAGAAACEIRAVTPAEWKGTEPKPMCHSRLWKTLAVGERKLLGGVETGARIDEAVLEGASDRWKKSGVEYYGRAWKTHNLLDAAAMGCVVLGRMTGRGTKWT